MPEETATAPVQDISKTPTLLETLAGQMDLSNAPMIRGKELPRIAEENDQKKPPEKKAPEKKAETETKPPEEKPEDKKKREAAEKTQEAEWKKAGETISEKLFKGRGKKQPPTEEEGGDGGATPAEKKVDEEPVKGKEQPRRKRASQIDEAEITERAAAAAAEAATRAVSKALPKSEPKQPDLPKPPEENLTPAERKQFDVYKELEAWKPDQYKGVTEKYLKSLTEIQDYVKTWGKENPGVKFDPNDEQHNEFFERVEPPVDEDDWDDAKANIRARAISEQAVKPLNEKLQQMERERAKTMMEPVLQQKTLEGVHMLLNEFDPNIAAEIVKPDGVKQLQEKDPITVGILNHVAGVVSSLVSEVVRLTNGGAEFDPANQAHQEIADFILGQEARISKLPADARMRDGKRFIKRIDYFNLPPGERAAYWFLDQDDISYLLAQKYALQAKKIRDAEVEKFNATAEKLGYKKVDGAQPGAKTGAARQSQTARTTTTTESPEALSRTSVKTAGGKDVKGAPSQAEIILGSMFQRLRS